MILTSLDSFLKHRIEVELGITKEPEPEPVQFGPPTREDWLVSEVKRLQDEVRRAGDPRDYIATRRDAVDIEPPRVIAVHGSDGSHFVDVVDSEPNRSLN